MGTTSKVEHTSSAESRRWRAWRRSRIAVSATGLRIGAQSIVESWERPVQVRMGAIVAKRGGDVLEVGYGLGMAAGAIRRLRPRGHWILEAHPMVARRAVYSMRGDAVVINALWQETVPCLRSSSFDGIAFDGYPIGTGDFDGSPAATCAHIAPFITEAVRLLKPLGVLAFLDFSCGVTETKEFARAVKASFSNHRVHSVGVLPPAACQYATGVLANVVELIR